SIWKQFPGVFWAANTMEIFERMAWYGWFAVSSLYITGSVESGGLGFTSEQRGIIQGIIPFILYLMPVVTGALADKFGYKRTFFVAYSIMTPAYFLLGQPTGFWGFFFVFLLLALGAALFKPVVVGTVSHATTDDTKSMGFGIFYMMVNIGGFVGPIVAGIVRTELGWGWVFKMSAIWIAFNFIWLALFYKEPEGRKEAVEKEIEETRKALAEKGAVASGSTSMTLMGALIRLAPVFIAAAILFGPVAPAIVAGVVIFLSVSMSVLLRVVPEEVRLPLRKTGVDVVEVLGNVAFFIMVIGTIFVLMLAGGDWISWADFGILAAVLIIGNVAFDFMLRSKPKDQQIGLWAPAQIGDWRFVLYLLLLSGFWTEFNQLFITMPEYIRDYTNTNDILTTLAGASSALGMTGYADSLQALIAEGYKINPEYLINIDAGAIVLFQVIVSALFAKWKPFTTMIVGTILTGVGMALGAYGTMGWIVVGAIFIFAIGEMMASPKSQEYVSRIAPKSKTAMYMGYYFVSIALGNLFGGILSGQMYGHFGRDTKQPEIMWMIFGAIGILTAFLLWLYDYFVIKKMPPTNENDDANGEDTTGAEPVAETE
ncbi:MFS transporter, partial [Myxococcota bacterium]|nr:MFS transporter [Myxococcota bacterium]